jgi:hypothetical protein
VCSSDLAEFMTVLAIGLMTPKIAVQQNIFRLGMLTAKLRLPDPAQIPEEPLPAVHILVIPIIKTAAAIATCRALVGLRHAIINPSLYQVSLL